MSNITSKLIEVMQAYERGETIQVKLKYETDDAFEDCSSPLWNWPNYDYRVKPVVVLDSVDWSHVADEFNYIARNQWGKPYAYEKRPNIGIMRWENAGGDYTSVAALKSFKPGSVPWHDSLIIRPGYKG